MQWVIEVGLVVLIFFTAHLASEVAKLSKRLDAITGQLMNLKLTADGISKGQENIWDKVSDIEIRTRTQEAPYRS